MGSNPTYKPLKCVIMARISSVFQYIIYLMFTSLDRLKLIYANLFCTLRFQLHVYKIEMQTCLGKTIRIERAGSCSCASVNMGIM